MKKQHPHLETFITNGKRLCNSDSDYSDLRDFNCAFNGLVSDKEDFQNNPDVLVLINKVESEVNAFINKLDKAEEWEKIDKAEKWKKIETDVKNLINKFKELREKVKITDNFWYPLDSILKAGEYLRNYDFESRLIRPSLSFTLFGEDDRTLLSDYPEVIMLMDKVKSEVNAFINKFGKSEPAVDSSVKNKPSGKI